MSARILVLLLASCAVLASCGDPTHTDAVSALGPEPPGPGPGPRHRPGQPCLVCHGGSGPASGHFSVAGTVYLVQYMEAGNPPAPASGVDVHIADATGASRDALTNDAGNFFLSVDDWSPAYPLNGIKISENVMGNQVIATMMTHVGRDGSCAACHYDPPSPATPGHIYLALQ